MRPPKIPGESGRKIKKPSGGGGPRERVFSIRKLAGAAGTAKCPENFHRVKSWEGEEKIFRFFVTRVSSPCDGLILGENPIPFSGLILYEKRLRPGAMGIMSIREGNAGLVERYPYDGRPPHLPPPSVSSELSPKALGGDASL
jgi:hypothetical protein